MRRAVKGFLILHTIKINYIRIFILSLLKITLNTIKQRTRIRVSPRCVLNKFKLLIRSTTRRKIIVNRIKAIKLFSCLSANLCLDLRIRRKRKRWDISANIWISEFNKQEDASNGWLQYFLPGFYLRSPLSKACL